MYELEWRTVYAFTRGLRSNEGNKHHKNTRVSAWTVHHENAYIILFLTQHNESINDDKNDDLHASTQWPTRSVYILLMTYQSIADDVTMTRPLWCDRVISNI